VNVSAVVVTWNCRDAAVQCVQSLVGADAEIIVVDNGSTDGTVDAVRTAGSARAPGSARAGSAPAPAGSVRVIANRTNRGLAAANNQGIVAATGDALLISNPDVVWGGGAVDAMVDVLRRRPRAAWVVPRLRYPDGAGMTSAGELPTLREALLGRQLARRAGRGSGAGVWWDGWAHDAERRIGRGHESAYLVRRAAVSEVGLQDERYRLDWEGVEWTRRMRSAGWEVWFTPAASVVHLGGVSIRQVPYRWVAWSHLGMYRYFADELPAVARPALAVAVGVRAALKAAGLLAGVDLYERAHRG
jgi:N-acetylglucosaminyl-diphospho-decaprenol L-rhamnosyltransferase